MLGLARMGHFPLRCLQSRSGPRNNPLWTTEYRIDDEVKGIGVGTTKAAAREAAARQAYETLVGLSADHPAAGASAAQTKSDLPVPAGHSSSESKSTADEDELSNHGDRSADTETVYTSGRQTQAGAPGTANSFAGANNVVIQDGSFIDIGQQTSTYRDCRYHTTTYQYVSPSPTHPANLNAVPWIAIVALPGIGDAFHRLRGGNVLASRPGVYGSAVDEIVSVSRQVFRDHPLPASVFLYFLILRLFQGYRSRAVQG
ncbi:hypothetical protein FPV67DRAFT_1665360 [Lyophyllum atratum]|nr:hypothetical protein FPV67DRAFT_1665360 [Lyophyllum atratum]